MNGNKFLSAASLFLLLTLTQTLFAQGLSKKCIDEFLSVPEKKANFEMQGFLKDLVSEVVKVKVQLKMPFGKPADSKVTDIGITVGCLKALPENPAQLQAALKDVGVEMIKRVANKSGTNALTQTEDGRPASATAALSTAPVLKECDAVFNPEKKFCYDGGVYDKCDGMSYNPTTHICSGDIANRALCGGAQYNPLTQKCENNAILAKCGEVFYNPKTHGCNDSTLFAFPECGETKYNPETHDCGENNVLLAKCGAKLYNSETHFCEKNVLYPKCGKKLYNPETHFCEKNVLYPKCGEIAYDPKTHSCDARDSKKYRTVKIGDQIWMAENLNYDVSGSKCYGNNSANCTKYGRLYDWETATKVCPSGWHLPSKSEYEALGKAVGGERVAGKRLKSKSGWRSNGNGTDEFGFSALPGGYGESDGSFEDVDNGGTWWTASESSSNRAYRLSMSYFDGVTWGSYDKLYLRSVRCLQD